MKSRLTSLWRNIVRSDAVERDLDEEVRAAFELLVNENVQAGMSVQEARRAASLELGGIEAVKQQVRDARAGALVDALLQDLGYTLRALRRTPLFTVTAVLSLGIGIAGTAVVFSLADAYLFRNRPGIADSRRLVEVGRTDAGGETGFYSGDGFDTFSYPNYVDYRRRQTVFERLAAYNGGVTFGLGTDTSALRVSGGYVSANYFEVLGVPIGLGRGFRPDEENPASPAAVAVISDRLWRAEFSSDPDVVGRTVRLNGRPFSIIGVAAPRFNGYTIDFESLWIPLTAYRDGDDLRRYERRGQQWLMGIGRLKDGATISRARDEMATIAGDLRREYPDDNRRHGLGVEPPGAVPVSLRPVVTRFVGLLFALVAVILAIACFNVAGVLLARGLSRSREIGVRLALGAARRRIAGLLVVEGLVISGAGATAGLVLASGTIRLVERMIPMLRMNIVFDLGIDWRVMAFSALVAVITGVACGLAPARAAARIDPAAAIKRGREGERGRLPVRSVFVIAQAALSVLLVVCAILLARSLRNASAIDPGFAVGGLEVVGLDLRLGGYDTANGRAFAETLMSRIENLPGVEAAASARVVPLTREREGGRAWLPEEVGDDRAIDGSQNIVTPGYFRTIGLTLVAGRNFNAADRAGSPAVGIVNETLARRAWPGQSAVGKRLMLGVSRRPMEIVGVVRDSKYRTIGESPTPFFYVPAAQRYESIMWILLRPGRGSAVQEVRALVREMDPDLAVLETATLEDMTAFALFPQRFVTGLSAIVGTIGVLLAALGVYGVTAYNVSRRRREIGIRVALGAVRRQVVGLIVGRAMLLAGMGATLGLIAAAAVSRFLAGLLYDIRPLDPISFVGSALVLFALAFVASLIPATRASAVSPVETLRAE